MSKGPDYEREICALLSRWWTGGLRDDIFWRSAGSGARATCRAIRGRKTAHQHGDVACTDPDGAALTDLFNIEIKRGYQHATCHELLDRTERTAVGDFEDWVGKAQHSCERAGTFGWLLITRRNLRRAMLWMPFDVGWVLTEAGAEYNTVPSVSLLVVVRRKSGPVTMSIAGMLLEDFLAATSRSMVEALAATV